MQKLSVSISSLELIQKIEYISVGMQQFTQGVNFFYKQKIENIVRDRWCNPGQPNVYEA